MKKISAALEDRFRAALHCLCSVLDKLNELKWPPRKWICADMFSQSLLTADIGSFSMAEVAASMLVCVCVCIHCIGMLMFPTRGWSDKEHHQQMIGLVPEEITTLLKRFLG